MRGRLLRRIGIGLLVLLAGAYGLHRLSGAECFQLVGEVHCRVDTDQKLVALTFDDGPIPPGVEMVLPILDAHGTKATFFLVGEAMQRNPGLARRMLEAGHELGNHSYTHKRLLLRMPSTYEQEVGATDALLRAEGVESPTLFRPPFGKRLLGLSLAVDNAGYRTIMWDVEEGVGLTDPREYADIILDGVQPGSIVLMHPMFGHREVISKALPLIIEGLEERGYTMVTVSELLAGGGVGDE